jgi:glycosyltransferase involved in cell wall biosynthesis
MLNVSVICPVYVSSPEEYQAVIANLSWVGLQQYPIGSYEVIVINNASAFGLGNDLRKFCESKQFKFIDYGEKRSSYAARNVGIRAAIYPIVAFIDADCMPDLLWLQNGVKALDQWGGIIAGHIEFTFQGNRPSPIEYADSISHLRQEQYANWGYSATANLITYREYFEICGLFPEVKSLGDREWCQTSRVAVQYCAGAIVSHPARYTVRSLLRKVAMQARAIHRLNPVGVGDLIRFWLPLRVWFSVFHDPNLPRLWNKLQFLIVLLLLRWISLLQSWGCLFSRPQRARFPRLGGFRPQIADLIRSR